MNLVFGIILLVAAVFLVVAVLMQSGKSHNLSGSIAGGAETFFGKTKGKTIDKMLSKLTTIVAIIFVILVIVVYVIQPNSTDTASAGDTVEVEDTAEDVADDTAEDVADDTAEDVVEDVADDTAENVAE